MFSAKPKLVPIRPSLGLQPMPKIRPNQGSVEAESSKGADYVMVSEQSCVRCRTRKVKCDRAYPRCSHCAERNDKCENTFVKRRASAEVPEARTAEPSYLETLEERLRHLERQVAGEATTKKPRRSVSRKESVPRVKSGLDLLVLLTTCPEDLSGVASPIMPQAPSAASSAFVVELDDIRSPSSVALSPESESTASASPGGTSPSPSPRKRRRSASPLYIQRDLLNSIIDLSPSATSWARLTTPQLAKALTQQLYESFVDSCCFLMPAFDYFSTNAEYNCHGARCIVDEFASLDARKKVIVAVFRAAGARRTPHSALLGVASSEKHEAFSPRLLRDAGQRRHAACQTLMNYAHELSEKHGILHDVSAANLACILALMQASNFVDLYPKKSRTLLRLALSHYKELMDTARSPTARARLKAQFAYAIYSADALVAAYMRRPCLVADSDLELYFDAVSAPAAPALAGPQGALAPDDMAVVYDVVAYSACHCQRLFARMSSAPRRDAPYVLARVHELWNALDKARGVLQILQNELYRRDGAPRVLWGSATAPAEQGGVGDASGTHTGAANASAAQGGGAGRSGSDAHGASAPSSNASSAGSAGNASNTQQPHSHTHSHSHSHSHSHGRPLEIGKIIRLDRDLIDLYSLVHSHLIEVIAAGPDEPDAEEEVRSGPPGVPPTSAHPRTDPALLEALRHSESRIRHCLHVQSAYARIYMTTEDQHMIYHWLFQMNVNAQWPQMALMRCDARNNPEGIMPALGSEGPSCPAEELSLDELTWLCEGARLSCFYTSSAEAVYDCLKAGIEQIRSKQQAFLDLQNLMNSFPTVPSPTFAGAMSPGLDFNSFFTEEDLTNAAWPSAAPAQLSQLSLDYIFSDVRGPLQQQPAPQRQQPLQQQQQKQQQQLEQQQQQDFSLFNSGPSSPSMFSFLV